MAVNLNKPTIGSTSWGQAVNDNWTNIEAAFNFICQGRLTPSSTSPVPDSDSVTSTTLYFLPYFGNRLCLYDSVNSIWKLYALDSSGINKPNTSLNPYSIYDVFAYDNAGSPDLELNQWTTSSGNITNATNASPIVVTSNGHGLSNGDTVGVSGVVGNTAANGIWLVRNVAANTFELAGSTGNAAYTSGGIWRKLNISRPTALDKQDGVYVKNGAADRRYLGTILTTDDSGTVKFEDSTSKRFVWNYYNRVPRNLSCNEAATSHNYVNPNSVWREAGGAGIVYGTNAVGFVIGVQEDVGTFDNHQGTVWAGDNQVVAVGIALDATNTNHAQATGFSYVIGGAYTGRPSASYRKQFTAGFHYVCRVETGTNNASTVTFYGDQIGAGTAKSGMVGEILA